MTETVSEPATEPPAKTTEEKSPMLLARTPGVSAVVYRCPCGSTRIVPDNGTNRCPCGIVADVEVWEDRP